MAVLKISSILIKYHTFNGVFSYFHGQNKYKIRVSVHCSLRSKKLINIKVRKISILAIKNTFLVQNRLNFRFSNLSVYIRVF